MGGSQKSAHVFEPGFHARTSVEFPSNALQMNSNRIQAEGESLGDFYGRTALQEMLQNLLFAIGKRHHYSRQTSVILDSLHTSLFVCHSFALCRVFRRSGHTTEGMG